MEISIYSLNCVYFRCNLYTHEIIYKMHIYIIIVHISKVQYFDRNRLRINKTEMFWRCILGTYKRASIPQFRSTLYSKSSIIIWQEWKSLCGTARHGRRHKAGNWLLYCALVLISSSSALFYILLLYSRTYLSKYERNTGRMMLNVML